MATVTPPTFAGDATIRADKLEAAFDCFVNALNGGLDESNLGAGGLIAPMQLAEPRSLVVLGCCLTNPDASAYVDRSVLVPITEESWLIGHRLYRKKTTSANGQAFAQVWAAEPGQASPGQRILTDKFWDELESSARQHTSFQPSRPHAALKAGSLLRIDLEASTANVSMVALQLFLTRLHAAR